MVTARLPEEALFRQLLARKAQGQIGRTVRAIGDAWAPGTIAAAVWSGRRYAEEFDAQLPGNDVVPFRREVTQLRLRAVQVAVARVEPDAAQGLRQLRRRARRETWQPEVGLVERVGRLLGEQQAGR